jgi:uncharacterized protein
MTPALADGLRRGTDAHDKSSARAVRGLALAAARGDARAQAQLGFMYENGFGVPQNYVIAADLYQSAAANGDVFGQSRLGLSYDKGHGVPQSVVFLTRGSILPLRGLRAVRPIIIAGFAMPLPRR